MSLSELSTEIDEMIIQYLPQRAVHNLMLTNKYYRKIAEPYLYRNVQVRSPNILSIPRLLLTLISRRELSQHIRSFAFDIANEQWEADLHYLRYYDPNNTIEKASKDLSKKSSEVQKALKDLAYPLKEPLFDVTWYYSMSREIWAIDASLALILCLATNLEHLRLMNMSSAIIEAVCPARWQRLTKSASLGVWPLGKLKSLDVYLGKEAAIPILAPIETLKASGARTFPNNTFHHDLQWSHRGSKRITFLRNLELQHITLQPDQLHRMLELPEMHGIQSLKMKNVCIDGPYYDYSRLGRLLRILLPSLKIFECTHGTTGWTPRTKRPFTSFKELTQLQELTITLELMTPQDRLISDTPVHLFHPKGFFPDSLRALQIRHFPRSLIYDLVDKICLNSQTNNYLLITAASLGLSSFDLGIASGAREEPGYKSKLLLLLKETICRFKDFGTSMEILSV